MAAATSGGGGGERSSTRDRLLAALEDLELLARELIEILAISRNQKLAQSGEEAQILELLIQRDQEFQELMKLGLEQGKIHREMQLLEEVVGKRDSDIQQLQKQLKEAEHILATAVYQAKEKLKSIEKARKGSVSSEEIIKYAHRISASNAVCAPLTWVPGDPRRPYPTDLEMRSGILGQMNNPSANGVNGHLPGDALAAGRLPDVLAPQYPWQSTDMSMNMLPPNHSNDFMLEPPGHNKENEDDVEEGVPRGSSREKRGSAKRRSGRLRLGGGASVAQARQVRPEEGLSAAMAAASVMWGRAVLAAARRLRDGGGGRRGVLGAAAQARGHAHLPQVGTPLKLSQQLSTEHECKASK
uniref:Mediator of RNA polymerase II transcription subunit 4 n=1 Tax=Sphaerodactylus townsendi TaxID=933632 RepID=A0ACB8GES3_9SAUR